MLLIEAADTEQVWKGKMSLCGSVECKVLQWTLSNQAGENMGLELRTGIRTCGRGLGVTSKPLVIQVMQMNEVTVSDPAVWNGKKAKELEEHGVGVDPTAFCPSAVLSFFALLPVRFAVFL